MSLNLKGATRRSLFWSLQLKRNQKKEYVGTQCTGFSSALVGSFFTDVSGQPTIPIICGQALLVLLGSFTLPKSLFAA